MTTREHRPLGRALEEAAEDVTRAFAVRTTAGTGIEVRAVRASARRRRARFEAGVGAVSAAVVAVTLLAAGALQGSDEPTPPAQTDSPTVEEYEVTPAPGARITCGSRLDALPVLSDGTPEVSVRVEVPQPVIQVGDQVEAVVTTRVVMDPSERLTYSFAVWLARDGVVVGRPAPGWTDEKESGDAEPSARVEERVVRARFIECVGDDTTTAGPGDYALVAVVSSVRVGLGEASGPFVGDLAAIRIGGAAPTAGDDDEWLTRFVGDEGWRDVDPDDAPGDLPLALDEGDEVIQSQAYEDGVRWRVTVAHAGGRDTYTRVAEGLTAAGYVLQDERTDPDRPFWTAGTFTRGAVVVHVDTSNETGGGFYTTFLLEASW